MDWWHDLFRDFFRTCRDILPIVLLFGFFQLVVLRQRVANLGTILAGTVYVVIGLTLFLLGLEKALFPLGKVMAEQLVELSLPHGSAFDPSAWARFGWIYLFAALTGFATTIAEPSLIAIAFKAREVSWPWGWGWAPSASSPARRCTSTSWPVTWWCWCRPVSHRGRSWPSPTIPAA